MTKVITLFSSPNSQPIIFAFKVAVRTIWDCYISTAIKITEPSKERLSLLWSDELGSVIFNLAPTDVFGPHIVLLWLTLSVIIG